VCSPPDTLNSNAVRRTEPKLRAILQSLGHADGAPLDRPNLEKRLDRYKTAYAAELANRIYGLLILEHGRRQIIGWEQPRTQRVIVSPQIEHLLASAPTTEPRLLHDHIWSGTTQWRIVCHRGVSVAAFVDEPAGASGGVDVNCSMR
jgi:hypothetical protein